MKPLTPNINARPHRHTRKYLHRHRSALTGRRVSPRIRAPPHLPIQQTQQTTRAARDGEEGDDDVDEQVDGEGSRPFVGTEAAEVVCREEEGEDGPGLGHERWVKKKRLRKRGQPCVYEHAHTTGFCLIQGPVLEPGRRSDPPESTMAS